MICKACGKEVPDNALYCPFCGAPLNKVDTDIREEERKEMEFIQSRLNAGKLYGIISIVCSILGLGSFGSLDIIAIICGYLGLKQLKQVPNTYPEKSTAVTLNRAGIICSAGFIFVIALFVIIALIAFPWIFASIAGFFAGLI